MNARPRALGWFLGVLAGAAAVQDEPRPGPSRLSAAPLAAGHLLRPQRHAFHDAAAPVPGPANQPRTPGSRRLGRLASGGPGLPAAARGRVRSRAPPTSRAHPRDPLDADGDAGVLALRRR